MTGPVPRHLPLKCFACETSALPVLIFRETAHGQA
jgi:hypothetical protein